MRLVTFITGDAYLVFIGNEFGHPFWVDFPTQRNNWSFKFCQRRWNLLNESFKFFYLKRWESFMLNLTDEFDI